MTHKNKTRIRMSNNVEIYNFKKLGGFERQDLNPENVK